MLTVVLQQPILRLHRRSPQLDDRVLVPAASPKDTPEPDASLGLLGIQFERLPKEPLGLAQLVAFIANEIEQIARQRRRCEHVLNLRSAEHLACARGKEQDLWIARKELHRALEVPAIKLLDGLHVGRRCQIPQANGLVGAGIGPKLPRGLRAEPCRAAACPSPSGRWRRQRLSVDRRPGTA